MKGTIAALALAASVSAGNATDLGVDLNTLAPCKPAAARYCDRTAGMTMSSLVRCGATLAALGDRVDNRCRQVLRQYGQL